MTAQLKALAGRVIEAADDQAEVVKLLRGCADDIERGMIPANKVVILAHDDSQVEDFRQYLACYGIGVELLGILETGKIQLLEEMDIL